jgi:hypothetical protein
MQKKFRLLQIAIAAKKVDISTRLDSVDALRRWNQSLCGSITFRLLRRGFSTFGILFCLTRSTPATHNKLIPM